MSDDGGQSQSGDVPMRIGEFSIQRELGAQKSYLAVAVSGRLVVLKRLEADCLLGGQLHPMIKDRLSRVRELAHLGVANLLTVQRAGEGTFLVWEYVQGTNLEEHMTTDNASADALRHLARELALHVETLHALGIVHGALHPRNIIVTPGGGARLTHVSPLLYQDMQVDIDALGQILAEMGLGHAAYAADGTAGLRDIIARISRDVSKCAEAPRESRKGTGIRRLAVLGAILVALLGAALAVSVWRWIGSHVPPQTSREYR